MQIALPPRPWPRQTWNQLSSLDIRLLDELAYLSRRQAEHSPTGAHYCHPGRKWLAQRLACSVETITRSTTKLKRLGLLHKFQRRPVAGHWQTCLYRLIHWTAWHAAAIRNAITTTASRLSKVAHIASTKKRVDNPSAPRKTEELATIITRWRARFGDPTPDPAAR